MMCTSIARALSQNKGTLSYKGTVRDYSTAFEPTRGQRDETRDSTLRSQGYMFGHLDWDAERRCQQHGRLGPMPDQ